MKRPSAPAATAARASGSAKRRSPPVTPSPLAGQLQRVRDVEDHRDAELVQDRERAHVDDQVVVAEGDAALGDEDAVVAHGCRLFDRVPRVLGGEELPLLDVDGAAGARRRQQQVGLAAEEGGDLQHVADLGRGGALRRLVDVGEQRQPGLLAHAPQHAQPLFEPRPAVALDRAAVGLVEGGLEDERQAEAVCHRGEPSRYVERQLLALDDAGAGDEREGVAADGDSGRELDPGHAVEPGPRAAPAGDGARTGRAQETRSPVRTAAGAGASSAWRGAAAASRSRSCSGCARRRL